MMEALINDSLRTEPILSNVKKVSGFKSKWETVLDALGQDTGTFSRYFTDIYVKYRNPMVHPTLHNLKSFDDISFLGIQTGYSNGWDAYSRLNDGLGHPSDLESWKIMCRLYDLPESIV